MKLFLQVLLFSALTLTVITVKGQEAVRYEVIKMGEPNGGIDSSLIPGRNYTAQTSTNLFAPPPSNDNCSNATPLVVNAACTSGTLSNAGIQSGEVTTGHCGTMNFTMTVWYKVTATAPKMWIQTYLTGLSGGGLGYYPARFTVSVFNTSACQPTTANRISCAQMNTQGNGDAIATNQLTGLNIGSTYLIQVGYNASAGSQDPVFCIRASDQFSQSCTTCATSCGLACGFLTNPSALAVLSTCANYPFKPYLEGGQSATRCYSFYPTSSSVTFQVIVSSTCLAGNVSAFTWSLYSSPCGAAIQTGGLASTTFTGLTPGHLYTFCYSFTVPNTCYHITHYPYFVGASPLPMQLLSFEAVPDKEYVNVNWVTATEVNNKSFTVQRSTDGKLFEEIGEIAGAGTSSSLHQYHFTDKNPVKGTSYYRLKQTDFDGASTSSEVVAVRLINSTGIVLTPNPASDLIGLSFDSERSGNAEVIFLTQQGSKVQTLPFQVEKGRNDWIIPVRNLRNGMYLVEVRQEDEINIQRFIKN